MSDNLDDIIAVEAEVYRLQNEVERLKRGDFTKEEFQNLCHNRHDKEGCTAREFYNGCAQFQKQMFGESERERFARLIHTLPKAVEAVEKDIITSQGETIGKLRKAFERLSVLCWEGNKLSREDIAEYCTNALLNSETETPPQHNHGGETSTG